jgi:tRNA (guanine37-N1)-methyltransferase
MDSLILLCGHYEGIDRRVLDEIWTRSFHRGLCIDRGELPALTVIDAVARMLPGVLPAPEAYLLESNMEGTLEGPQYTRPAVWKNREVPQVLLSGHHANIGLFRRLSSLETTRKYRPDLFNRLRLDPDELERLLHFSRQNGKKDGKG